MRPRADVLSALRGDAGHPLDVVDDDAAVGQHVDLGVSEVVADRADGWILAEEAAAGSGILDAAEHPTANGATESKAIRRTHGQRHTARQRSGSPARLPLR